MSSTLLGLQGQPGTAHAHGLPQHTIEKESDDRGSHLEASLFCRLEVSKRIAAVLPFRTKAVVFRAVVNEALLSALEARALPSSDLHRSKRHVGCCREKSSVAAVKQDQTRASVPLVHCLWPH